MKFLPKRNSRPGQEIGRQRLASNREQSRVFSYHASRSANEINTGRSQEATERLKNTKVRMVFSSRVFVGLFGMMLLIATIGQLFLGTSPKVVVLSSANARVFIRNSSVYDQAASKLFAPYISNRNKLTIDTSAISSAMKQQFPELSDVSVALPFFGKQATMYIQPSEPSFVLNASNGSFVLDPSGRALIAASSARAESLKNSGVPTITDQSGLRVSVGSIAIPGNDVSFISSIARELNMQHIGVQQITLPPVASETDMYIAGKPYFVKFDMQDYSGALQQAGALVATINSLASKGVTPAHYIDVRIDGRIYYQ